MPTSYLWLTLASLATLPLSALEEPAREEPAREDNLPTLRQELAEARRDFDDARLEALQQRLLALAQERQKDPALASLVAESYIVRATQLRTARTIGDLEPEVVKLYRQRQKEWGASGLSHARRALQLTHSPKDRAQAERRMGELYVHQINGPIAGIINGPKALQHVRKALSLSPDDPECNRAQGLMFLYNPPINGGDVDRAIQTFRDCIEQRPANDSYHVYLALAFRKKGNLIRAEFAARKALQFNPKNRHAQRLLRALQQEKSS